MVRQFGAGTGPIRLSQVGCAGSETRLIDCPAVAPSTSMCNHDADVGVICQPLIFPGRFAAKLYGYGPLKGSRFNTLLVLNQN